MNAQIIDLQKRAEQMSSTAPFNQFAWMRAWMDDGRIESPVTVACLAVMFQYMNAEGRAWAGQDAMASKAKCHRSTLSRHINLASDLGWLEKVPRFASSTVYIATYPSENDGVERHDNRCGAEPVVAEDDTSCRTESQTHVAERDISCGAARHLLSQSATSVVAERHTTCDSARHNKPNEQPNEKPISAKPARELKSEIAMDEDTTEIHDLLKIEGHPVSNETASVLKTKIEKYQPNALAYLEARLINDSMGGRFKRTRSLLRALEQDAVNDGAAVYQNHPDDPAPATPSKPKPAAKADWREDDDLAPATNAAWSWDDDGGPK